MARRPYSAGRIVVFVADVKADALKRLLWLGVVRREPSPLLKNDSARQRYGLNNRQMAETLLPRGRRKNTVARFRKGGLVIAAPWRSDCHLPMSGSVLWFSLSLITPSACSNNTKA